MKRWIALLTVMALCVGLIATGVGAAECCETSATYWYFYENYHYAFCVVCGGTKVEMSEHQFQDGVCNICGFQPCPGGAHIPGEFDPHECGNCMMLSDCVDHDGDGLCDLCGEKACPCNEWICVPYEDGCIQQCTLCGNYLSEKMAHCFAGTTTCLNCGTECSHGNISWEFTPEEHYGHCMDCWTVMAEWGPHELVDGVCIICDIGNCDHSEGKFNWGWNNLSHEASCAFCGKPVILWSSHEYDEDGVCKVCGFVGCFHGTLEEAKDVTLCFNEQYHWYTCNLCEYAYTDMERHAFVDGVCTICGAAPCAPGDHTLDWERWPHPCIWCNARIGCMDENLDCKCDLCKTEHHSFRTETTETHHRVFCITCELLTEWEEHYSFDAFVGCDYCGYGSPRAEEKVEVSEDAPETQVQLPSDALLSQEEKDQIAAGVNVEIKVNIQNADQTVTVEDKAVVEAVIEQSSAGETVALYLNIDLTKTVGESEAANITETDEPVTITITIPEALQQADRSFSVIRVHDGVATQLPDLDKDPATVTIQTDRFSTYALVYREEKAPVPVEGEKPQQDPQEEPGEELEELPLGLLIGGCAAVVILGVVVVLVVVKKKRQ